MNLSDATMNCQPPSCDAADAPQAVPFFGHLLVSVSHHWRRVLEMRLAELGLTDATWRPLFHLHQAGQALSLKQLAQRMGLDSSSLVRVVDLLEDRGLVLRVTDAADRRSKQLLLTADGQAMVADVHGKLQRVEQQLLEGLPASAVQALVAGLLQLDRRLVQASQPPAVGTCDPEVP